MTPDLQVKQELQDLRRSSPVASTAHFDGRNSLTASVGELPRMTDEMFNFIPAAYFELGTSLALLDHPGAAGELLDHYAKELLTVLNRVYSQELGTEPVSISSSEYPSMRAYFDIKILRELRPESDQIGRCTVLPSPRNEWMNGEGYRWLLQELEQPCLDNYQNVLTKIRTISAFGTILGEMMSSQNQELASSILDSYSLSLSDINSVHLKSIRHNDFDSASVRARTEKTPYIDGRALTDFEALLPCTVSAAKLGLGFGNVWVTFKELLTTPELYQDLKEGSNIRIGIEAIFDRVEGSKTFCILVGGQEVATGDSLKVVFEQYDNYRTSNVAGLGEYGFELRADEQSLIRLAPDEGLFFGRYQAELDKGRNALQRLGQDMRDNTIPGLAGASAFAQLPIPEDSLLFKALDAHVLSHGSGLNRWRLHGNYAKGCWGNRLPAAGANSGGTSDIFLALKCIDHTKLFEDGNVIKIGLLISAFMNFGGYHSFAETYPIVQSVAGSERFDTHMDSASAKNLYRDIIAVVEQCSPQAMELITQYHQNYLDKIPRSHPGSKASGEALVSKSALRAANSQMIIYRGPSSLHTLFSSCRNSIQEDRMSPAVTSVSTMKVKG